MANMANIDLLWIIAGIRALQPNICVTWVVKSCFDDRYQTLELKLASLPPPAVIPCLSPRLQKKSLLSLKRLMT